MIVLRNEAEETSAYQSCSSGEALSIAEEGKQRINPSAVEFIDIGTTSGELNLQFSEFASAVSFLGIAVCVIIAIAHWDYDRLFLRLTRLTSCG